MCDPILCIEASRAARASRICRSEAGALTDEALGREEEEEVVGEVVLVVAVAVDTVGGIGSVLVVDMVEVDEL